MSGTRIVQSKEAHMKKIIIGGILSAIVIIIMGMLFGAASSEMYKMSPKTLWKPMGGNWFTEMIILDLVTGFILAGGYSLVKKCVPGQKLQKGLCYGLLVFVVGPFLGLTMTYLTMAVRTKLIAVWALNGFVNYILSGLIFAFIDEKIS